MPLIFLYTQYIALSSSSISQVWRQISLLFSKNNALVYVGETKNINGVIGRANQHISRDSGTLYSRLYDKGYDLDDIDDFILLSYPLPREKRFLSEETSYRMVIKRLE